MSWANKERGHVTDVLFTLALFCVFAASAVLVMLFGARVYQNTVSQMDANYTERICLAYVSNKVRQHDSAGQISLGQLADTEALILADTQEPGGYVTYIYFYDGALRELYCDQDAPLRVQDGVEIVPLQQFSVTADQAGRLHLAAQSTTGQQMQLLLAPRSQQLGLVAGGGSQ